MKNIDNIPNFNQFIDINSQVLKKNLSYLSKWQKIINDFTVIVRELRIELCKVMKDPEQKQDYFYYYKSSLTFFSKQFFASIERLLQGHISYAFMHPRLAL